MKTDKTNSDDHPYLIKELAEELDVSVKTIKNWENKELIPKANRNNVGWRVYSQNDIDETAKIVRKNNYFVKETQK